MRPGHEGHTEERRGEVVRCSCGVDFTLPPESGETTTAPAVRGVYVTDPATDDSRKDD